MSEPTSLRRARPRICDEAASPPWDGDGLPGLDRPDDRSVTEAGLRWSWYRFDELPPRTLYGILKLRQAIFIVEQNVAYADIDGKDLTCAHLVCTFADEVVAYARAVPEGLFKPGAVSFGRVTVRHDLRRVGLGKALVARVLERIDTTRGALPIEISSQYYLKTFYASFGFIAYGEQYIEDQISHIAMRRA
ncbi:GNAT family N-acetyltransferase [Methylorubrum sp. SB2]|uniref:GNAT family N-acetyltransferase n=1 Tax=Methylorubrum subtropicum TaxID=3138812 RepID=UPI00313BAB3B